MYGNQNNFFTSKYLDPDIWFSRGYAVVHALYVFFTSSQIRNLYFFLLFLFATFFIFIIIYSAIRVLEIRKKEHAHLEHEIAEYAHYHAEREKAAQAEKSASTNPRWVKTLTYLFSDRSSDWKLAIIEADAMLDSLMGQLGFNGETLGDKLKSATQETFRNLTIAWEVHTIRNRIAHEGLSYEISQYEAKRVISIYEKIFREYGYV